VDVLSLLSTKGRAVHTIDGTARVSDAVDRLHSERVGALVVTGASPPMIGLLSERDIVVHLAELGASVLDASVTSLMVSDVPTCAPATTMMELMSMMTERRIRHVPVIDDNELVGLVSIGDVVKARLDELERERRDLLEYVSAR
jgi:CBS domain-containing protein